ncbi:hypothetical protein [Amycolatopsis solani]|uniref:hypothetical protein n=1 Tax=Amycolatopsis solani TaxID=3028615 RepID=UPI0025B0FEF4|nr:hypothetical protein [Amycolatopsis sp. MEP2-6]
MSIKLVFIKNVSARNDFSGWSTDPTSVGARSPARGRAVNRLVIVPLWKLHGPLTPGKHGKKFEPN